MEESSISLLHVAMANYPKPGVSRRCLWAVGVWFPVTSAFWGAILYAVVRLVR